MTPSWLNKINIQQTRIHDRMWVILLKHLLVTINAHLTQYQASSSNRPRQCVIEAKIKSLRAHNQHYHTKASVDMNHRFSAFGATDTQTFYLCISIKESNSS
jgi:hypothetical protein